MSVPAPVRPPCCADASRTTPTWRPGLGISRYAMPSTVARPADGSASPQIIRNVVDLPAPLGPTKPVTVPGAQRNETSLTATTAP